MIPCLDDPEPYQELSARQKILARLCLTSKELKAVAEPHLYHALSNHDSFVQRHVLFIRSLYERPGLGSCLCRAAFEMYTGEGEMEYEVYSLVAYLGACVPLPADWENPMRIKWYHNSRWKVG